ncbi:hypothetical protein [Porphyrobacter sp. GA68]|uniref:hypothetical protein n=1 Tax=Porphyrobacter sp. GA68 TaxID=2883480 RepID=UPI001D191823|nr:hypothetical protein [Porphyrobacter sp. GA68]
MNKATGGHPDHGGYSKPAKPHDWRRTMSDNVATALLVYTTLQIFFAVKALSKAMEYSLVPYLALLVLVAAFIPVCRHFEKRWARLPDHLAGDMALRPRFREDAAWLWLMAIGIPLLLTWAFKLLPAGA